jgi:phosphate transport system substrate-binding protein
MRSATKGVISLCLIATVALAAVAAAGARSTDTLTGAGSTFVYPLVSKWIPAYQQATGTTITYGSVGSGAGIAQITARTVDFGASDAPLTPDQYQACNGCVQIPWAVSATSVDYKVSGIPQHIKLTGAIVANMYLGKITNWNDPAVKKLNPGVNLPSLKVTPIYRSDGSGTTYNFTDYLSSVSGEWKSKVGVGTAVSFPTGVGGKGNSGVSGVLSQTEGGVAYTDVAYAVANHFQTARIANSAGKYMLPDNAAIQAAANTVTKVPANNEMHIVSPPKSVARAYPISTFTYVILPLQTPHAAELRKFVFWALTAGQKFGPPLRFVSIPKPVLVAAEKTLKKVQSSS